MKALIFLAVAASGAAPARAGEASGSFLILKEIVASDSRYAGAPRREEAVSRLAGMMRDRGLKVEITRFASPDPRTGRPWKMANLIGRYRPESSCRFLLGTHFDTRHVAEEDPDPKRRPLPIPGANDGSSGVAVLLDLASRFGDIVPAGVGVDVALFDGEEMGYPDAGGYCAGSTHYAARAASLKTKPKFGIILDMVCAPSGVYKIEPISARAAPRLVEALWDIGERRDGGAFSRERFAPITDDHVPLSEAGIPSALLIGFDYPQWHTSQDTIAQCSAARLDMVEGVLKEFIQTGLAGATACAKAR